MVEHLHHVHVFAADLDASIAWYRDMLGGTVDFDGDFGGARNVFMRIGAGRLHFYDQRPRGVEKNAVHHLGVRTDDLEGLVARLRTAGHAMDRVIREFGSWKYFMCEAPDQVLLELFEVDVGRLPTDAAAYFNDSTDEPLTQ